MMRRVGSGYARPPLFRAVKVLAGRAAALAGVVIMTGALVAVDSLRGPTRAAGAQTGTQPVTVAQLNPTTNPPGGSCLLPYSSGTGFQGVPAEVHQSIDLSAYDGQAVQLRFYFSTRDNLYNDFEGWYVKNITVTGTHGGSPVTAFSDPVSNGDTSMTAISDFGTAPGWHVTDRRDMTLGGPAWWYGNETTGTYQSSNAGDCTDSTANAGTLTSPTIQMPANSQLSFDTLWQIESVDPATFDLMDVQVIPQSNLTEFNCPGTAPASVSGNATPQPLGTYVPTAFSGQYPLHGSGGQIVGSGGNVRLKAVNWYGAESSDYVPMGLDKQSAAFIAGRIAGMGFNTVRLPWSNELVECNPMVSPSLVSADPTLKGLADAGQLTAMAVYDYAVNAIASHGLYVVLDNHMTDARWCCDSGNDADLNNVWWQSAGNSDYSVGQSHWQADWATMVQRYSSQHALIGVDLRNEPRGPTYWGGTTNGLPNGVAVESSSGGAPPDCPGTAFLASEPSVNVACDWRWAAQTEGDNILSLDGSLLIFVEGVNLATDLTGAYTSPVNLISNPSQLVYSAHVYDFSSYCINSTAQKMSQCPQNSNTTWGNYSQYCQADYGTPPPCPLTRALDSQWGFVAESGDHLGATRPIWVGEFGTTAWNAGTALTSPDTPVNNLSPWFRQLRNYFKATSFSYAYWAVNGTVEDGHPSPQTAIDDYEPYGLLNTDWSSPNPKLLDTINKM